MPLSSKEKSVTLFFILGVAHYNDLAAKVYFAKRKEVMNLV